MPLCPRCDYDLAGQVATWLEVCPLRGTCPECGLEVEWRAVFRRVAAPRWSVEHAAAGTFALGRAAMSSARRAFTPSRLWRGLTLELPVVPRRLLAMFVIWLPVCYVLSVLLVLALWAGEAFASHRMMLSPGAGLSGQGPSWSEFWLLELADEPARVAFPFFDLRPIFPSLARNGSGGVPPIYFLMAVTFGALLPASLAFMPASLRRARVRGRHIVRLAVYWAVCLPILGMVPTVINSLERQCWTWSWMIENNAPKPLSVADLRWLQALRWAPRHDVLILAPILLAAITWWWRCALRWYLRLPAAFAVSAALVVLTLLATAFIMYFLAGASREIVDIFEQFSAR